MRQIHVYVVRARMCKPLWAEIRASLQPNPNPSYSCYGVEATIQWLAGNRKRGAENGYLEVSFAIALSLLGPSIEGEEVPGVLLWVGGGVC